jgi:predicted MPP superfamily phosphohydrolase
MKNYKKYLLWCAIFLYLPNLSFSQPLEQKNNSLIITDIHVNLASRHTMDISPIKPSVENDLDLPSFNKTITRISENIKNGSISRPNFILILGDLVGHVRTNTQEVIETEALVFNELKNNFPKIPIFYVFGNNDSLLTDYGPFKTNNTSEIYKSPYEIAQSKGGWKNGFLSNGVLCQANKTNFPCILHMEKEQGYYAAYLAPKLRLIALNSVIFSANRKQVSKRDALEQLQWLQAELKAAQSSQESVLLAMHIPPGRNVYDDSLFWLPKEQSIFLNTLTRYQPNILGLLVGHTHAEELKVIQNSSHSILTGVYFTAALSTSHGNSPSVKTFYFCKNKRSPWQLTNFETFHFYTGDDSQLLFNKLYDYKSYYCDSDKNATSLSKCLKNVSAEKMKKNFTAGNENFLGNLKFPNDIFITLDLEK